MEALSFGNNVASKKPDEVVRRLENQENFTAIDSEKLKQDTVELANKTKENANENIIFKTLRKIGVNDPKKTLKSLGLSILTVITVAILGNKLSTPSYKLGNKIDNFYY